MTATRRRSRSQGRPRTSARASAGVVVALAATGAASSVGCVHAARAHSGLLDPGVSVSVGSPSYGYLLRGRNIPARGPGYELFRTRRQGGETFGTERLVSAIQSAARYVARNVPDSAPLRVGDLSAPRGGHIDRHASHRSGRDADLIFYALDTSGHSVPAPAFVRYDREGHAVDPRYALQFDVHRNWRLVESLVRDVSHGVIRIFVFAPIRALLLEHARAHGRDPDLIARAELVLHQPGDSAPHDDHFHVRVACRPEERVVGCRDGGPIWWWLEREWGKGDSAPADDDAVLAQLFDDGPATFPATSSDVASFAPASDALPSSVVIENPRADAPFCIPSLSTLRAPRGFRPPSEGILLRDDAHVANRCGQ